MFGHAVRTRFAFLGGAVPAALLALAACGGSSPGPASSGYGAASSPSPAAAAATPTPAAPLVLAATATVDGKSTTILTDARGMTLYVFAPDRGAGKITCTMACIGIWPPLVVDDYAPAPTGGPGVGGTFSTLPNPDGKGTQVLFKGWPLYHFARDAKPGDTTGQGVGGKWSVATPDMAANS